MRLAVLFFVLLFPLSAMAAQDVTIGGGELLARFPNN